MENSLHNSNNISNSSIQLLKGFSSNIPGHKGFLTSIPAYKQSLCSTQECRDILRNLCEESLINRFPVAMILLEQDKRDFCSNNNQLADLKGCHINS